VGWVCGFDARWLASMLAVWLVSALTRLRLACPLFGVARFGYGPFLVARFGDSPPFGRTF
jgi:hypothetical protein